MIITNTGVFTLPDVPLPSVPADPVELPAENNSVISGAQANAADVFPGYPRLDNIQVLQIDRTTREATRSSIPSILQQYQERHPVSNHLPIYNPKDFRHPNAISAQYQLCASTAPHEFSEFSTEPLRQFSINCMTGFHPLAIETDHPIHKEMSNLCIRLMDKYKALPLEKKINHFENAVAELVAACVGGQDPNLLNLMARNPKFELIEIAIRNHFFLQLLESEKAQISTFFNTNKKLPDHLPQTENLLLGLATKKGFYQSPYVGPSLLEGVTPTIVQNCLSKTASALSLNGMLETVGFSLGRTIGSYKHLISAELKTQGLTSPSQCSLELEAQLRIALTRNLISKLATQYKMQFEKTGEMTRQIENDIKRVEMFGTNHGKLSISFPLKIQLLSEIFDLANEQIPFTTAKVKVTQQKDEALAHIEEHAGSYSGAWKYLDYQKLWGNSKKEIETLAQKKTATIALAEKMWIECFAVPAAPIVQPVQQAPVPLPQIQTVSPIIAATPVSVPQPQKETVTPHSYVDIVFAHLLQGSDSQTWMLLAPLVKKDVLRHATSSPQPKGKAEEIALRIFKGKEWEMLTEIPRLGQRLRSGIRELDPDFKAKGEEILDFYYSSQIVGNYHKFLEKFQSLPIEKEPNFLKYVYESAKKSNVYIDDSWDHQWAKHNWSKRENILISLQALERCLHT